MAEKKIALWKRIVGYLAFGLLTLLIALWLTFPYDALRDQLVLAAARSGYDLKVGSIGPGLLGVRATEVELMRRSEGEDKPPEALKVDSLTARPTLFPPGVSVSADALGGATSVRVTGIGSTSRLRVDAEDLDLGKGNLKGFSGMDLSGTVEAHLDLTLPRAAFVEGDLTSAVGSLSVEGKALTVNGGSVSIAIPQFGPGLTPIDLPKIGFGDLTGAIKLEKGSASIEELKAKGQDLEIGATGTLKVAKKLDYWEPTVEVRYKADPEFQKRLGLVGSALSMVGPDPKDPTWRLGRLSGYLNRPNFR